MGRVKLESRIEPFEVTIFGEPASKANSRRLVFLGGKPRFIKSAKALSYGAGFNKQCPYLDPMFLDNVRIEIEIYYANKRSDLDESLILDLLQGRIYPNDRQVFAKHIIRHTDRDRPRSVIRVTPLASGAESGDQ